MQPAEPVWCAFCADRPAVGHMIVMVDGTNEQIGALSLDEGVACDLCGRGWTGAVIAERDDDGRLAVLQYMHPDFEKITEKHIKEFASEHACNQCGDPTEELPLWMAERVLRANPQLALTDNVNAICVQCAKNYWSDGSETPDETDQADGSETSET